MTNFLPEIGMLFYAESLRDAITHAGDGSVTTVVKRRDTSYDDNVFRCKAIDAHVVVADVVYGSSMVPIKIFPQYRWRFHPLGPGVASALGLEL